MELRAGICHRCLKHDKGAKTPHLLSVNNEMNPGKVFVYLPKLSQLKEMIIARYYVQIIVFRYRSHQYYYSGYCVSFMQNIVKTVDVFLNLPTKLEIVLLRLNTASFFRY